MSAAAFFAQVGTSLYADQTIVHPVGLAVVGLAGIAVLLLPRRFATLPVIAVTCFIPTAQRIVVAGLDFDFVRIMVLFGWARLMFRGEFTPFTWKKLDTIIVLWALVSTLAYTIMFGTFGAFVYRTGTSFDAIGLYFFFRCTIRSWEDIDRISLSFIMVSIPIAILFWVEKTTGRNPFSLFGGVPEFTNIRKGRLRCQGAFSHPILAGCFWASVVPLIAARYWSGKGLAKVMMGIAGSLLIVVACASSTPVMAVAFGTMGAMAFFVRHHLRAIRWMVVVVAAVLHVVRDKPIWHLISRIDLAGGSTGHHRYRLIDAAVHRFTEWAAYGVKGTAHWGWGLGDITNHYIFQAVRGGIFTLALFVAAIAVAFNGIGTLSRMAEGRPYIMALTWAMGISLFQHCTSFIAVTYFGQIMMIWYLILAMIGSMTPTPKTVAMFEARKRAARLSRLRAQRARTGGTS